MGRFNFIAGILAVAGALLAVFLVLTGDSALLTHPKGIIAHKELYLMITNVLLMFAVIIPTYILLFIYPEQEIATVNLVRFPARTPIHFDLSADNSPMNSFWIPQLSGQIYTMTGMATSLNIMADGPGEYVGRAAEINGKGFADMTFTVQSCSDSDFDDWVRHVKQSPLQLTAATYRDLVARSVNNPVALYSHVEKNMFDEIVMKPLDDSVAP